MGPAFLYVAAIVILIVSVVLIVTALRRRIRGLEYKPYLASGCISLICPVLVCAAFGFAWIFSETDFFAAIFFAGSPEMKELLSYMARHHEDLEKSFTDEQKETFEKFHDCWSEYMSLAEKAIFVYAFKLGAKLMIESLK